MRMTVDDLLIEARGVLRHRPGPAKALAAQAAGALLVDIRSDDLRRAGGLVPGLLVLPRHSLEWRCDPAHRAFSPVWRRPPCTGPAWSMPPTWTEALSRGLRPACRW
jgi:hypothetical protein